MPIAAAFNSNLYVVAATVIPVYFVAMMLPGSILPRYFNWAKDQRARTIRAMIQRGDYRKAYRAWEERERERGASDLDDPEPTAPHFPRLGGIGQAYELLAAPVWLVFLFGGYGEIQAVLALDHQAASVNEHQWVMDALLLMPILLVVSTMVWAVVDRQRTRQAVESGAPHDTA